MRQRIVRDEQQRPRSPAAANLAIMFIPPARAFRCHQLVVADLRGDYSQRVFADIVTNWDLLFAGTLLRRNHDAT